jgi:threonine synthase
MDAPQLGANGQVAGPLDWNLNGERLSIANLPPFDVSKIVPEEGNLWRYTAMLPAQRRVTLGEGLTPLIETRIDDQTVWVKLEYLNPTGSFKDRGTSVLVNHLLAHDVTAVIEDSSGNAGASLAAYTAAAGIQARVFVPAGAPEGKKRLIAAFGAELVEITGPRAAATAACLEAAKTAVYASHAWSPFFVVGQMTCAWEIWEQNKRRAPDAVACCVGHGGLFLGLARGFKALLAAGLIERLPRFYAVQSAACDPVVQAWERGLLTTPNVTQQPSVADGIAVTHPVHGAEILSVVRETGGAALRVRDDAILKAQTQLHRRGFMVEPTSGVPVAALAELRVREGADVQVVVPLTGSGLKTLLY